MHIETVMTLRPLTSLCPSIQTVAPPGTSFNLSLRVIEKPAPLVSRDRVSRRGAIPLEGGGLRHLTLSACDLTGPVADHAPELNIQEERAQVDE